MTPFKYTEQNFEDHIEEQQLLSSGYKKRKPEEYDFGMCLVPEDVLGFIKATQPKAFRVARCHRTLRSSPALICTVQQANTWVRRRWIPGV